MHPLTARSVLRLWEREAARPARTRPFWASWFRRR